MSIIEHFNNELHEIARNTKESLSMNKIHCVETYYLYENVIVVFLSKVPTFYNSGFQLEGEEDFFPPRGHLAMSQVCFFVRTGVEFSTSI